MQESPYIKLFDLAYNALNAIEKHEEREIGPAIARKLSERTGREERPLSTTECHVLEQVQQGTTTAARIAETLDMTRGGVSKAISKLAGKGFLETPRSQDNAREVMLRLTPRGEAVCEIHAAMHSARLDAWSRYLDGFDEGELGTITRFLEGLASFDE